MFTLSLLFNLIKENPVKIILLISCVVSSIIIFNDTFPDVKDKYTITIDTVTSNTHLYIIENITEGNSKKYELCVFNEPQTIENGKLISYSSSNFNIIFWILFIISGVIVIIGTIGGWLGEENAGWDFNNTWDEAFKSLINCEFENGKYYYTARGRLIKVLDRPISSRGRGILSELNCNGFKDLRICPKFKTKSQKRESNLDKLGI